MADVTVKSLVPQTITAVQDGSYAGAKGTVVKVITQTKELAPVDFGELKGSYMWKDARGVTGQHEKGPVLHTRPEAGSVIGGSASDHAVYQEFGTRKMEAQPHFRPAIDMVTKGTEAEKAMADAMQESVRRKLGLPFKEFKGRF